MRVSAGFGHKLTDSLRSIPRRHTFLAVMFFVRRCLVTAKALAAKAAKRGRARESET